MEKTPEILAFWRAFQEEIGTSERKAEHFEVAWYGDSAALGNQLVALILEGKKTASCASLAEYEHDQEPLPVVGGRCVVVNGHGQPVCVTETTAVFTARFNEVDAAFAFEEGEDDRSLASWRREHQRYFSRVLPPLGGTFSEDLLLVCERFKVIYQPDPR